MIENYFFFKYSQNEAYNFQQRWQTSASLVFSITMDNLNWWDSSLLLLNNREGLLTTDKMNS